LAGLVFAAHGARADSSSSFVSMVNSARSAHGLAGLSVSSDLSAAARAQASRMAASRTLAHTPNLGGAVCCWSVIGENVGEGPSAAAIETAFMNSTEHRANILSGSYTQIGVGAVVDSAGVMWVSEIFRRPSGAVAAPAPKPVVTHHAAPQPAPTQHHTTVRPPVATLTVAAPPAAQPPVAAQTRASRDLSRVSLAEAQRLASQLDNGPGVRGPDPVTRLLDFVAINATLN
ncbi:CAP domain-containing protein, partial [Mycobacterium sp.]|uniref:CAP domain-containing protein n=1 Tax=Mycobacterium sp. TaxID=1785 RepID=UPI0026158A11